MRGSIGTYMNGSGEKKAECHKCVHGKRYKDKKQRFGYWCWILKRNTRKLNVCRGFKAKDESRNPSAVKRGKLQADGTIIWEQGQC